MSIGTLMAYTMVGVCILILRYQDSQVEATVAGHAYSPLSTLADDDDDEDVVDLFPEKHQLLTSHGYTVSDYVKQLVNWQNLNSPTRLSAKVARANIILFSILCIPFSVLIHHTDHSFSRVMLVLVSFAMMASITSVWRQPPSPVKTTFRVPGVPWLPAVSVLINVFLTTKLSLHTWARFAIWMTAGFLIYGLYGWRNSSEEYRMKGQLPPGQVVDDLKLNVSKEKADQNGNNQ
jgi:amino acid transporter